MTTPPRPIKKLLVANRGEIAIRIFRTAAELGIKTVAVFTPGDDSHAEFADERVQLDVEKHGGRAGDAFLDVQGIVGIAKETLCDAIAPGYGFLAENPALASLCAASNIIFVGPHPTHVTMFGDKLASKDAAIKAGVPVVPGSPGPVAGVDAVKGWGDKVGYPIVIKNAAGGGGRGIRIVRAAGEVAEAYARCVGEVAGGAVFVEKAVIGGRHIEVQVIGDGKDAVHLYERDCSVQRRFQKIVEIAPSPDLDPKLREQICADAVKLAKSVGYRSLGTVEFMVQGGKHYFLEVNPRIQVEHTCTEQVTGHDLVALQLAIAQGATISSLGLVQSQIKTQGFAIQLRVTAEDPLKAFEPSNGDITKVQLPAGPGIRVDTHLHLLRPRSRVERPIEVGPFFDSLLAKTIVTAPTWELARNKALRACRETLINGVATNTLFLERLMEHPAFASYKAINTLWVEDNMAQFTVAPTIPPPEITSTLTSTSSEAEDGGSVLPVKGSTAHTLELNWNVATADNPDVMPDYEEHQITIRSLQPDKVDASLLSARVQIDGTDLEVRIHPAIIAGGKDDIEGLVKCAAPHDGLLVSFAVKEGDMVNEGDEVAVISRMKMETSIKANATGVVRKVGSGLVKQGKVIKEGMGVTWIEATNGAQVAQAKL